MIDPVFSEKDFKKLTKYIQQEGYEHIVVHPQYGLGYHNPSAYKWDVFCSSCGQTETIKLTYDEKCQNNKYIIECMVEKTIVFAKKHKHDAKPLGLAEIQEGVNKLSNKNVSIELNQGLAPQISMVCKYCFGKKYIPIANGFTLEAYAEQIETFSKDHVHPFTQATVPQDQIKFYHNKAMEAAEYYKEFDAKEQLKKYEDYVKYSDFSYPTYGSTYYQEFGNVNKPGKILPVDNIKEIQPLGNISINMGGRHIGSVSISQDILKEVYKLSNFNVDLQAKVSNKIATSYRAICTKCNGDLIINYEQLISTNRTNNTWTSLTVFCTEHRHFGDIQGTTKVGRKFKQV